MTQHLAIPPAPALRGTIRVPPSKGATNRALLVAALTDSPVEIVRPLESADIAALRRCLDAMGASIVPTAEGLRVCGPLAGGPGRAITLDAADSGTAARFLCAVAAAVPGRFVLTGSRRLCERPIGELVEALRQAGAAIAYREREGFPPLEIEGGTLRSGEVRVDASRSSQFLSALLIAAVAVEGGLAVRASGPIASAPYVGTTLELLRQLGHEAEQGGGAFRVRRGARVAVRFQAPGDWSSAVPLLAAVLSAGGELTLSGLCLPSEDADARALPVLERMGLRVLPGEDGLTASAPHSQAISPVGVEATHFPDAVPVLAALAALAEGTSRFSGIGHLRLKESDRIAALCGLLGAAGASAVAHADALEVSGPARLVPPPVRLPTFADHRMAMAAAVFALRRPGMLVEDPDCVAKSYPRFFRDLDAARARDNT